ncbi:hypothetical protein, partial [Methylophaga sp.]|uniref:hypothetical protein n=1 Tax=Methylophaga sp. TaxID=2024840 RepID=UPI00299E7CDF
LCLNFQKPEDQRQQGCLIRPARAHPCDAQHMTSMSCDSRLRQSLLPLTEHRVACWRFSVGRPSEYGQC